MHVPLESSPARRDLVDLYAPVTEDLAAAGAIFDREIESEVPCVAALCARVRAYRGKMMRPALLLLTGKACGEVGQAHRVLAAVVEMVHVATLVHDDVLDESAERRCQPTIHAAHGNVSAVLLGDYLISHAFHLCSSLDSQRASRLIGATTNVVCEGELLQNELRGRRSMTESQYFDIIRRKTGSLTATACELGASFAAADERVVRSMRRYGEQSGIAFQIVDDVLDLVGKESRVGKTLWRDLDLGKLTLPILHALNHGDDATRACVEKSLNHPSEAPREDLRFRLETAGSIEYALDVARQCVSQALACLDGLHASAARDSLRELTEFILRRNF